MTIDRVTYKQKFFTGSFLNCDIGFEASVDPGEDPLTVLVSLKKMAESSHQSEFPHLYTESGKPITFEQIPETRTNEEITHDQQVQGYFEIIKMVTTQKQLEMHRGNIEKLKSVSLTVAFENKLQSLQNQ